MDIIKKYPIKSKLDLLKTPINKNSSSYNYKFDKVKKETSARKLKFPNKNHINNFLASKNSIKKKKSNFQFQEIKKNRNNSAKNSFDVNSRKSESDSNEINHNKKNNLINLDLPNVSIDLNEQPFLNTNDIINFKEKLSKLSKVEISFLSKEYIKELKNLQKLIQEKIK